MIGFFAVVLVLLGLIHLYLWKRLVRDPFRPGWRRRTGGIVIALLGLLVPATLIGVRSGSVEWLAWPGYVWIGLMFYLLVVLLALEIVRPVVSLIWRRKPAAPNTAVRTNPPLAEDTADMAVAPAQIGAGGRDRSASINEGPSRAGAVSTGGAQNNTGSPSRARAASNIGTASGDDGLAGDAERTTLSSDRNTSRSDGEAGGHQGSGDHRAASTDGRAEVLQTAGPTRGSQHAPATDAALQHESAGIDRRLLLARGAAIFAGLTAAAITGYGMKTALGPPRLDRVQIPLAKLPRTLDGTRLAVVADIHLGPLAGTSHAARIVDMINSVDADIVCIVGDLVDGDVAELGRHAAPLANIRSRQGAYFVTGNHEYYSGFQQWVDEVARLGVRPLRNERLELGGLDLAGVNDLTGTQFGDAPDFRKALGDRDPARPVILMAHQPLAARQAAPYAVDLQVSGHTHGGQMVPFNLLVRLEQPLVSGFGRVDGVPVYVTDGAGFWGPPVRVGVPPQVTVVDLRAS